MRIAIKTLGCKSNRYESDKLLEALSPNHEVFELNEGANTFKRISEGNDCDLLIVNTCTVTNEADRKSRQTIRSFKSLNPSCEIVVFGCGANVSKEDYKKMKEVSCVAEDIDEILNFIKKLKIQDHCEYKNYYKGIRTRALVKIQDGCNNYCTYCIIPMARGSEISFDSKKILEEVQKREKEGFKEIILTGIIMSNWEENEKTLPDLIEFLIKNTKNIRFRISSLEPKSFSDKFYKLFQTGRLCPHIHMSLQSGSDSVLKRMRRNYDTSLFLKICEKFRKFVPDIGLTTDVIVGFPGETDEEFEETCQLVEKIGFLKIHVFPYSKRKNTAAYHMKSQITSAIKKERANKLRIIGDKLGLAFKKSLLGKEYEVLVEPCKNGICKGFTPNYIPVQFSCSTDRDYYKEIVKIKLQSINDNGNVNAVLI